MQSTTHKIIIGGTGRAGTTVLVRLLTECGVDTGFTRTSWKREYFEHCQAGLEQDILAPDSPYVVKSPDLCETLPGILATGTFTIDHAIVPIRDLEAASLSRARIGGGFAGVPGGLWKTDDPARQKAILAELFHQFMHTLAVHDIPVTLLAFPRFVREEAYAYEKLRFLIGGLGRDEFGRIFREVADPGLVHAFEGAAHPAGAAARTPPAMAYAESLERSERRRRRRRVYRRVAAASLAAALVLAIAMSRRVRAMIQPPWIEVAASR
ncbi:MAG: hypothetical protein ACREFX_10175 [Opitutaceae bacterium]